MIWAYLELRLLNEVAAVVGLQTLFWTCLVIGTILALAQGAKK